RGWSSIALAMGSGNTNVHGHNMWAPMKFIINSNIYVNNYIIKYTPFFITFLFNYFFSINLE
ncbi:hypothetical protein, partial [Enterobacter bugandensis]|uniref:hypothetical protein n=1 Tax=Enterobacter bugandensis TaxID=881260 RepID=UPI0019549E38